MDELLRNAIELEKANEAPDADWLSEMRQRVDATGAYSADDLFRLLGDPRCGVQMGVDEEESLAV